jgi:hypothetical protein
MIIAKPVRPDYIYCRIHPAPRRGRFIVPTADLSALKGITLSASPYPPEPQRRVSRAPGNRHCLEDPEGCPPEPQRKVSRAPGNGHCLEDPKGCPPEPQRRVSRPVLRAASLLLRSPQGQGSAGPHGHPCCAIPATPSHPRPTFTGMFVLNGAGKLVSVGAGADEGKGGTQPHPGDDQGSVAPVPQLSPTHFRLYPKKPPCINPRPSRLWWTFLQVMPITADVSAHVVIRGA